jgi:hypothetical protein
VILDFLLRPLDLECLPIKAHQQSYWIYKCSVSSPAGSWGQTLFDGQIDSLAIDPAAPQIIYAGSRLSWDGAVVYRSTNGGDDWSVLNTGLTADRAYALAIAPKTFTVYVGTDGGMFRLVSSRL